MEEWRKFKDKIWEIGREVDYIRTGKNKIKRSKEVMKVVLKEYFIRYKQTRNERFGGVL